MSVTEILQMILIILQLVPVTLLAIVAIKRSIDLMKAKQWEELYQLLLQLVQQAEPMFDEGSTKKEWVMSSLSTLAKGLGYKYSTQKASDAIDEICAVSKNVNTSSC